jgi:hypothetical protein
LKHLRLNHAPPIIFFINFLAPGASCGKSFAPNLISPAELISNIGRKKGKFVQWSHSGNCFDGAENVTLLLFTEKAKSATRSKSSSTTLAFIEKLFAALVASHFAPINNA